MSNGQQRSKWSQYEKWLKPIHLKQGRGVLTIVAVEDETLYDGHGTSEVVPVATFKETRHKLALTNTNRHKLLDLFGDEIADTLGKRIVVEVSSVRVGPTSKQVIRITSVAPPQKVDVKTGEITEGGR
jgi:hypothetical protein